MTTARQGHVSEVIRLLRPKLRVEISFAEGAHKAPITGRVFVVISRTGEREPHLHLDINPLD